MGLFFLFIFIWAIGGMEVIASAIRSGPRKKTWADQYEEKMIREGKWYKQ